MRQNANENGHITPFNGRPGAWNGASGRHRAPLLRKSRKSANIHIKMGFIWGFSDEIVDRKRTCAFQPGARFRVAGRIPISHCSLWNIVGWPPAKTIPSILSMKSRNQ
jgi:hypothetical protein